MLNFPYASLHFSKVSHFAKVDCTGNQSFLNYDMYDAVQKVSKSFLRRYTLLKFQTLAKLITLIINSFYSMLCRKASDSWVCAANARTTKNRKIPRNSQIFPYTPSFNLYYIINYK